MRDVSRRSITRDCGRPIGQYVKINQRPDGRTSVSSIRTCDSNWTCIVCASRKAASRAKKHKRFLRERKSAGCAVVTVTLTVAHYLSMRLNPSWDTVADSVNYVTEGASWSNIKRKFGVTHLIKAMEVTHGTNGWHPHVHMVLVIDPKEAKDHDFHKLEDAIWNRWSSAVTERGYRSVREDGGIKMIEEGDTDRLAEYLEKGHRLTSALPDDIELSAQDDHMPFEIGLLACSEELPDAERRRYLRLWHEWDRASLGRRAMWWSQNLNQVLGEAAEDPDDDGRPATYEDIDMKDIDDLLPKSRTCLMLFRSTYLALADRVVGLQEIIENQSVEAATAWLDYLGLPYDLPPLPQSGEPLYGDWIVMEDGTRVLTGRFPHPRVRTYAEAEVLSQRRKARRGSPEWHERRRLKRGM